jgi:hypothetical protein
VTEKKFNCFDNVDVVATANAIASSPLQHIIVRSC